MFSKVSKKIVAATLAVAVTVSCASIADTKDASAAAKLSKKSLSMTVGGKDVKLKASAKAKWSTSNKNVATVKGKGKTGTVTAVGKGSCTITAKVGKEKLSCKVKVAGIQLSKKELSLQKGQTHTLKATVVGSNKPVRWTTSDKKVATVSGSEAIAAFKRSVLDFVDSSLELPSMWYAFFSLSADTKYPSVLIPKDDRL